MGNMAENQNYMFNVDADVSRALDNLNKVAKLMQTIENLRNKGQADYFTTNQKDMDKNMRSMKQLAQEYVQMMKEMGDISKKLNDTADSMFVPDGASEEHTKFINKQKAEAKDAAKVIIQQQKSIKDAYVKTLMTFRELSSYQQNYSKNFKHLFSSNDVRNLPRGPENYDRAKGIVRSMANDSDGTKLGDVIDQIKSVTKLNRRSESISRRGAAANYLSTQQAASFKKDYQTVNGQYKTDRDTNLHELTGLGQRRTDLHDQIKRIETNPFASQEEVDKKIAMQGEVEQIDKEWEARMELNKALEQTIAGMKKYNEALQGVEQKPERGTFRGMAYERAPAIGLALTGAVGGAVMSLYNKGAGISRGMRPDEVSIGQRTDTDGSLWRSQIRNGALNAGLANRLGFSGSDMLGFENNYLSNNGFTNMQDMNAAMTGQAVFSRTTGLNTSDTNDLFSTMFNTGAVKGDQVKNIQDGIIGAMKRNGMEGREKEQVKALQSLVQGVSQGRTLSNNDINNVMGLQSLLAGTGARSLQGQNGADLLNGMNQGIRQGITDPTVRMVFGQGTKYQGLDGRFALRKQLDKGISDVGNVNTIAKFAQSYGGKNKSMQDEAFASFVQEKLGTNITGEQAQKLMDLSRSGKLTQGSLDKTLQDNNATGSKTAKSRMKNYNKSSAAIDNQSDAVTEKQAAELYDFGEAIRKVNASMGGMNAGLYAAIVALTAFTVAVGGSALSFGGGRLVRMGMRGTFRNGAAAAEGETASATGLGTKFKNMFKRGGNGTTPPSGGPAPEGGPSGPSRVTTAMEQGSAARQMVNGASAVEGATGTTSTLGKIFGAGKNLLGKAMLPLAIASGVMEVATAKKGHKGEATGHAAGSILGGIGGAMASAGAGAAAGAAIGSIVPVGGTIVGGIVGGGIGLLGGLLGSKVGGSVGGWMGKQFDPHKAEAAELSKSELAKEEAKRKGKNDTEKQSEKNNTDTAHRTENKKSDNLQYERQNLHQQSSLLDRVQNLLQQARSQNGIIGNMNGVSGGGSDGSGGGGGQGAGKVDAKGNAATAWNFLASKGMSAGAISGILGNLQQESSMNPNAKGGGLAQWIGSRGDALKKYAKQNGLKPNSMEAQLGYLWKEMSSGQYVDVNKMNGMNASQAAQYFEKNFEKAGKPMMSNRINYANDYYDQFGSAQMSSSSAGKSSKSSHSVSVNSKIDININGGQDVATQVGKNNDLKNLGAKIQQMIFGSTNYYSKEMKMT